MPIILRDLDGSAVARLTRTPEGEVTLVLMSPPIVLESGAIYPAESFTIVGKEALERLGDAIQDICDDLFTGSDE